MNSLPTVVFLSYALVFAPGCKQRAESKVSEVGQKSEITMKDVEDKMREVKLNKESDALFGDINKAGDHFSVYVENSQGKIKQIDSDLVGQLSITEPLIDSTTNQPYKQYYIQRSDLGSKTMLGLKYSFSETQKTIRGSMSEIELPIKSTVERVQKFSAYNAANVMNWVKSYASVTINLAKQVPGAAKKQYTEQAQRLKKFFSNISAKMEGEGTAQGLNLWGGGYSITAFVIKIVLWVMLAVTVILTFITIMNMMDNGGFVDPIRTSGKYWLVFLTGAVIVSVFAMAIGVVTNFTEDPLFDF